MAAIDQLKTAMGAMFFKDLNRFDPGHRGVVIGDYLRVYDTDDGLVLRFLAGTPPSQRQPIKDRLATAKVEYTIGVDFAG